jgi:hypothetical protein
VEVALSSEEQGDGGSRLKLLYLEDILILVAIAALFVLTVFFRDKWWGQAGLVAVLVVMVVVCFFRLRRVHRAFTGRGR